MGLGRSGLVRSKKLPETGTLLSKQYNNSQKLKIVDKDKNGGRPEGKARPFFPSNGEKINEQRRIDICDFEPFA